MIFNRLMQLISKELKRVFSAVVRAFARLVRWTYGKAKKDGRYLGINVNGNKKLVNSNDTRWIIWNIPAIMTCPGSTHDCRHFCYAAKAEKQYPSCANRRRENYIRSLSDSFVNDMIYTIETELRTPKCKNAKRVVFCIHESGDFYNREYTEKWLEIIAHFKGVAKLQFQAYTKSLIYFPNNETLKREYPNFSLLASVWDDTKPEQLALIQKNGYRVYTAGTPDEIETALKENENAFKCRCNDCGTCGLCLSLAASLILCEIH